MTFNIQKLSKVVEAAKGIAPQMSAQIDAAAEELLCNPYISDQDGGLLWLSSNNGIVYFARENACTCKAGEYHKLCRHRLANRLVRLYIQGQGH